MIRLLCVLILTFVHSAWAFSLLGIGYPKQDYSATMRFAIDQKSIKESPYYFTYILRPTSIDFSRDEIDFESFRFQKEEKSVLFAWPKIFGQEGNIVLESKNDKGWSEEFDHRFSSIQSLNRDVNQSGSLSIIKTRYLRIPFDTEDLNKKTLRYCLYLKSQIQDFQFCSPSFTDSFQLSSYKMLINSKLEKRKKSRKYIRDKSILIEFEFKDEAKIKWRITPPEFKIVDYYKENEFLTLFGKGLIPKNVIEPKEDEIFWKKQLPIKEKSYRFEILSENQLRLYKKILWKSNYLPEKEDRLELKDEHLLDTYWWSFRVFPKEKKDLKFVKPKLEGDMLFFTDLEKGQDNKIEIKYKKNNKDLLAYLDIYRSFPMSIESSISGPFLNFTEFQLFANVDFSFWFQSILGWRNKTFSQQRWGIFSRYYRTIIENKNAIDIVTNESSIEYIDARVQYKLLHNGSRGEDWLGLQYSLLDLNYKGNEANLMGVGFFWQSRPFRIVDKIFEVIPLFRYPKKFTGSLNYYVGALDNTEIGGTFTFDLNFYIYFSPQTYFGPSLSLLNFNFRPEDRDSAIAASLILGKLNLGFRF